MTTFKNNFEHEYHIYDKKRNSISSLIFLFFNSFSRLVLLFFFSSFSFFFFLFGFLWHRPPPRPSPVFAPGLILFYRSYIMICIHHSTVYYGALTPQRILNTSNLILRFFRLKKCIVSKMGSTQLTYFCSSGSYLYLTQILKLGSR